MDTISSKSAWHSVEHNVIKNVHLGDLVYQRNIKKYDDNDVYFQSAPGFAWVNCKIRMNVHSVQFTLIIGHFNNIFTHSTLRFLKQKYL